MTDHSQLMLEHKDRLVNDFLSTYDVDDPYSINCGYCDLFSETLITFFSQHNISAEEIFVDNFLSPESDGERGSAWNLSAISHYSNFNPPDGLTWDDMNQFNLDMGIGEGSHIWVYADGKHYDAEAIMGVENPFELPYFRRLLQNWMMPKLPI